MHFVWHGSFLAIFFSTAGSGDEGELDSDALYRLVMHRPCCAGARSSVLPDLSAAA